MAVNQRHRRKERQRLRVMIRTTSQVVGQTEALLKRTRKLLDECQSCWPRWRALECNSLGLEEQREHLLQFPPAVPVEGYEISHWA